MAYLFNYISTKIIRRPLCALVDQNSQYAGPRVNISQIKLYSNPGGSLINISFILMMQVPSVSILLSRLCASVIAEVPDLPEAAGACHGEKCYVLG
jgi:hypothetical protein